MELNNEQRSLLYVLKLNRGYIKKNTLKTIKGQILKGDTDGARKGINRILKEKRYSNKKRRSKNTLLFLLPKI